MPTKRLVRSLALSALLCALPQGAAAAKGVFTADIAGVASPEIFPHWSRLVVRVAKAGEDKPLPRTTTANGKPLALASALPPASCDDACARAIWTRFLESLRGRPWLEQLEAVNRWANAKPYIEDWINWGVSDYWETPAEFVRRGGDCEDFAIAKYFSLIRLGFAPEDLRIVVVDDRNLGASHAVLAVRHDGDTWLMDIMTPQVVPMALARQYSPVYAFNATGWWLYAPAQTARPTAQP